MPAPAIDCSVIIATRNYGRFLETALSSVLAQTAPPREVIVVDDGSDDETGAVLERFGNAVRVIRQDHEGQAAAWNRGFAASAGRWIAFLDADDWWLPDRLYRCLAAADVVPDAGVIMHDLTVEGGPPHRPGWIEWTKVKVREGQLDPFTVRQGLPWVFVPTSGFIARRAVLAEIFPLDPTRWKTCADAPVLHRSALLTGFRYLPEKLGIYRLHGENAYHQQGWYDGDEQPRIILDNLWLTQRLAAEVNHDLRRRGRRDRVALWNNHYYSRMIGWVAGAVSWWRAADLVRRKHPPLRTPPRQWRAAIGETIELYRYQRKRDSSVGRTIREIARLEYPSLDLVHWWRPRIDLGARSP